jgi:arylformamidase
MIVDLTLPIRKHWRWPLVTELVESFEKGNRTQVTRFELRSHWYTHVDAPRHVSRDGKTLNEFPLSTFVGEAQVLDFSEVEPNEAIDSQKIEKKFDHKLKKDMLIFRTDWARKTNWETYEYWDNAPYITECGAKWIRDQNPKTVGFDFPQDHDIRLLRTTPISELNMPTHEYVLKNDILMIEYLHNLWKIDSDVCRLIALPLNLENADGAPVRVIAITA